MRLGRTPAGIVLVAMAVSVAGCSSGDSAAPAPTVTVTEPAPAAPSVAATPTLQPSTPPVEVPTAAQATITVPPGIGLDYQQAQDLWRGVGLSVMPATDATGANRIPVLDSNWVVLAQDPAAGAVVPAGSSITATVKKYSDG